MSEFEITSPTNDRIKRLVRLKERGNRDTEGVFVVEGKRLLSRAQKAGLTPVEIYSDGRVESDSPTTVVSPEILDKVSYRQRSEGVIAVFEQFDTRIEELAVPQDALILIAEGIEKPGNLGAMLRTADAVAADALIAVDGVVDVFNPNVLRTSTGAVFTVPLATVSLDVLATWLEKHSVRVVAAKPDGGAEIWETDLSGTMAIAIGAEAAGITPELSALADTFTRIPMAGESDSLNASVAMAVIAFEAKRQRTGQA